MFGETDPTVSDDERHLAPVPSLQLKRDLSSSPLWKGVFQGVGDEFVDDEAAGYRPADIQRDIVEVGSEPYGLTAIPVRFEDLKGEVSRVLRHVHAGKVGRDP